MGRAPSGAKATGERLTGADALRLHLTLAAGLALCVAAFTFELLRALGGHEFSWLYVFEWPVFAGFALYMWWSLLNGHDRRRPASPSAPVRDDGPSRPGEPTPHGQGQRAPGDGDEDLQAWNRYLRDMEAAEGEDEPPD